MSRTAPSWSTARQRYIRSPAIRTTISPRCHRSLGRGRPRRNRRLMLSLIAGAVVLPGMAYAVPAPQPTRRRLRLSNPHTGETYAGLYRDDHGPLATAMADLSAI